MVDFAKQKGIAILKAIIATIAMTGGIGLDVKAGGKDNINLSGEDDLFLEFNGSRNIKTKGDVNIKS